MEELKKQISQFLQDQIPISEVDAITIAEYICELPAIKAIQVEAGVKPESTNLDKQENIVAILSDMITEIADRREILDEHIINRMTHQEQIIIGDSLKKILSVFGLKVKKIV